jgi:hypothetical protein
MVGHPQPGGVDETRKNPYQARQLEGSTSKFRDCASGLDGKQEKHEGLYWFEQNVPTFRLSYLYSCTRFAVGVTNGLEREGAPKSLMECVCEDVNLNVRSPWRGISLPLL